ncbi:MAG: hypothetical protein P8M65_11380, partial [Roseibacillus sp.]|nr:hypothetical protein [Roseibacillus sp.]
MVRSVGSSVVRITTCFMLLSASRMSAEVAFEGDIRPILESSCLKCHGGETVKGSVDFKKISTDADADAQFELWETVVEVVEAGEMPPEGHPQLTLEARKKIAEWYELRLSAPVESRPGVFKSRRLSGPEYRNSLRSLFGFDLEVV